VLQPGSREPGRQAVSGPAGFYPWRKIDGRRWRADLLEGRPRQAGGRRSPLGPASIAWPAGSQVAAPLPGRVCDLGLGQMAWVSAKRSPR
jgi:hypothetical protein